MHYRIINVSIIILNMYIKTENTTYITCYLSAPVRLPFHVRKQNDLIRRTLAIIVWNCNLDISMCY